MGTSDIPTTLGDLGLGHQIQHIKTLTSAVTTAWGVDWDEGFIARDLMQNFYDANRGNLAEVRVEMVGSDVRVTAPAPFNLERLFYLGSEKGEDDVGQYGEGFKVAATCLLRDHAVNPIAASGHDILVLRVADRAVPDTRLYPVEYDFYRTEVPVVGTVLWLRGCSRKLARAVSEGMTHFFHPDNPLLGAKRWAHYNKSYSLYDATDGKGHVFYRGLKRGEIEDVPVVLVIDKKYEAIERKVSKDRDRNAFGEEVMRLFYTHFARYGLKGHTAGQRVVVEAARRCWAKGHPLLSEIADATTGYSTSGWATGLVQEIFGDGYYARSTSQDAAQQLQYDAVERRWREEGRQGLPQYFKRFGLPSAEGHLRDTALRALEEERRKHQRPPSPAEEEAVRVLVAALQDLAPDVHSVFAKGITRYSVAHTEALLGQLKRDRGYRSREVFLAGDLFVADFARAIAVFLHEHAHIFGTDGSRGFTDALTELLETVVRHREDLASYETAWAEARANVVRERDTRQEADASVSAEEWLAGKTDIELRALLRRLPAVAFQRLRREHK